ncbi:hypothetical protein DYB30_003129 [Aphanomyces astaci]|uniref:Uncharacterized protein n=1 Tax=Aphanomyces astaci TaxID=112090 RepID=A0A397DGQ7_APHAT|nr:hypothetical protein DYB30_003129 [Aphanomyces astaci]
MRETTVPSPSAWQERTLFVKEWLLLQNSLENIPDDGTEDLREVPVVKLILDDLPEPAENVSPSRGKLRPGKELVVLPTKGEGVVPSLQLPDGVADDGGGATSSRGDGSQRGGVNKPPSISKEKTFSSMGMMERQAEWLRKKQEKVDAEEKRQREEKEKELTFKPNLLNRRQTMSDKPEDKGPKPASVVKQNSFNEKKLDAAAKSVSFKESRPPPQGSTNTSDNAEKRPVSRSLVDKPKQPKPPKAVLKKKKSVGKGVDTKLEVTSHLLNGIRSELKASKAMTLDGGDNDDDDDDDNAEPGEEPKEDDDNDDDDDETPLLPGAAGDYKIDFSGMETKARLVLQDAALFELNSMYRKTDKAAGREGVALQMGRREDNHEEQVVAVIFDKDKISEDDAQKWWLDHKARFFELPANNA